ncbi:MAG: helix-turn-helix transcriptional regulator [Parasphingorhabdus sp.]|nr:helix-turn-helix transcriptional regulator [Parasphingorhabdus sp.]
MVYATAHTIPDDLKDQIREAATRLKEFAFDRVNLRVSLCDNIASKRFVHDEHGSMLNEVFFGWSAEEKRWWETKNVTYFSPVTIGARYECEPFWCNKNGFYTRTPNPALFSLDLSKIEHFTGRKAALVVPIHLPFGRIAAVTFHPEDGECDDLSAVFEEFSEQLEQLSRQLVIRYVKAIDAIPKTAAYPLLGPREIECLQWAAGGKTDGEIAQIIARSHATIRFHIRSAMEKLDSVNRSQAIYKAAQLGYLAKVH